MEWLKPSEGPTLRSWVRHMFISAAHLAGQHLAQLHAPLVKAVDPPDEALPGITGSAYSSIWYYSFHLTGHRNCCT